MKEKNIPKTTSHQKRKSRNRIQLLIQTKWKKKQRVV